MFDLHGKVAVVTGASVGLGRGFAFAMARQGADVAILARRKEKLDQVAEEVRSLGVKCLPVKCDVNDLEEVKAALDTILTEFGKVDILINNAGGGTSMPILEMTDEAYFKDINTDLLGLFKCLREFGKVMVKQGYGRIINIASILGLVGENGVPVAGYQSAKGGVVNLTRCAATELATTGVTVNAICPGFFPSESNGPAEMEAMDSFIRVNTPMDRPGLPSELDKVGELEGAAVFLASDEASYVTGTAAGPATKPKTRTAKIHQEEPLCLILITIQSFGSRSRSTA